MASFTVSRAGFPESPNPSTAARSARACVRVAEAVAMAASRASIFAVRAAGSVVMRGGAFRLNEAIGDGSERGDAVQAEGLQLADGGVEDRVSGGHREAPVVPPADLGEGGEAVARLPEGGAGRPGRAGCGSGGGRRGVGVLAGIGQCDAGTTLGADR